MTSDTEAREALAKILWMHDVSNHAAHTAPEIGALCDSAADTIIAAGWRPPLPAPSDDERGDAVAEEIGWSYAHGLTPRETAARVADLLRRSPVPADLPANAELEIVNGWLVKRGARPEEYPAGVEYGPYPYSDAEPLVHLSELPGWPVPADTPSEVEHGADWSDWGIDHPEEGPSCKCGFNGSPEECAASRATPPEDVAALIADRDKWKRMCAEETLAWVAATKRADEAEAALAARTASESPSGLELPGETPSAVGASEGVVITPLAARPLPEAEEWEYASALVAPDGTYWDEEITSLAEARRHVAECDGEDHDDPCVVVKRTPERPAGTWLPVPSAEGAE